MRGMCGWFSQREASNGDQLLQSMLAAHHGPVGPARKSVTNHSALAAFGSSAAPRLLEHEGFVLAVAGHPRLREDRSSEDLAAMARQLRERGKDALDAIGGDFALAAWDSQTRRGLLAIDLNHAQAWRVRTGPRDQ